MISSEHRIDAYSYLLSGEKRRVGIRDQFYRNQFNWDYS